MNKGYLFNKMCSLWFLPNKIQACCLKCSAVEISPAYYRSFLLIINFILFFNFAGLIRHHPTQCPSQSLTWALPSSRHSSSMLPWPTPSWSTCVCWTSTQCPLPLVTLASSVPLVSQNYYLLPTCDLVTWNSCTFMAKLLFIYFFYQFLSFCNEKAVWFW